MCFPLAGYRAHQTSLQAENTGGLDRLNLVTENLPVTEKFAAPTIPVLTAGSLVTE